MKKQAKQLLQKSKKTQDSTYKVLINSLLPSLHLNSTNDAELKQKKESYFNLINGFLPAINLTNNTDISKTSAKNKDPVSLMKQYYKLENMYKEEKQNIDHPLKGTQNYLNAIEHNTKILTNTQVTQKLGTLDSFITFIDCELQEHQAIISQALKQHSISWDSDEVLFNLYLSIKMPQLLRNNEHEFFKQLFDTFLKLKYNSNLAISLNRYQSLPINILFLNRFNAKKQIGPSILLFLRMKHKSYFNHNNRLMLIKNEKALIEKLLVILNEQKIASGKHTLFTYSLGTFRLLLNWNQKQLSNLFFNKYILPFMKVTSDKKVVNCLADIIKYYNEQQLSLEQAEHLTTMASILPINNETEVLLQRTVSQLIDMDYLEPIVKLYNKSISLHNNYNIVYLQQNPSQIAMYHQLFSYFIQRSNSNEAYTILVQLHQLDQIKSKDLDTLWLLFTQLILTKSKHLATKTLSIIQQLYPDKLWEYHSLTLGNINPNLFVLYYNLINNIKYEINQTNFKTFIKEQENKGDTLQSKQFDHYFKSIEFSLVNN
ncbi:hypothetical protein K502DRAFT_325243 [Neoconidiobolus thromboides FSU 785]|nr:hypothetical protein K502DRAFT_325243 [Neoconidiobolus thromboides FSU 785]